MSDLPLYARERKKDVRKDPKEQKYGDCVYFSWKEELSVTDRKWNNSLRRPFFSFTFKGPKEVRLLFPPRTYIGSQRQERDFPT